MAEDIKQEAYADQIATVIQDFVHLWAKFEGMLHHELARTGNDSSKAGEAGESRISVDYSIFYRVSNTMYRHDNMTMGELSNALSVPLSTATRMVDWLVSDGYVQRLPDPEDRRIVRVALTEKGRKLYETVEAYTRDRVIQVFSCLTSEEQATLFSIIDKVIAELKGIAG